MKFYSILLPMTMICGVIAKFAWRTHNDFCMALAFIIVVVEAAIWILIVFLNLLMPEEQNKPLIPFLPPGGIVVEIPEHLPIFTCLRGTFKHEWCGHDIRFTDEIEAWCKENGVKHWAIVPEVIWPGKIAGGPIRVAFPSSKKAVFFKLRWF